VIIYLVFVTAGLMLFGAFAYIRSMFKGHAKPNRVSWLMWAIAPFIATAAAVSSGVGWSVLPVFMAGFSPFLIFCFSFAIKKAYWKLATFDYVCGILSGLSLVFWYLTKNPDVAILFAIASDGLASIPTIKKALSCPETESIWPYITGTFGALSSLLTLVVWTFSGYAFPAYLIFINAVLLISIYKKQLETLVNRIFRRRLHTFS